MRNTLWEMTLQKLVVAMVLAFATISSYAGFYSTEKLREAFAAGDRIDLRTNESGDSNKHSQMVGFVEGVHDSLEGTAICTPAELKAGQLLAIVRNYVEAHPQNWNDPTWSLVGRALKDAYPCKR